MVDLKRPWLWLPPQSAHDLIISALKIIQPLLPQRQLDWQSFEWQGLRFSNRLGVSGGVDKNAEILDTLWALGVGFVEVGTVTPRAQSPNPGSIMARDLKHEALWNKMGFPNLGAKAVAEKLACLTQPYPTPVFINVGKNRDTQNNDAAKDYIKCIQELSPYADAFVINISSPNTKGLRDLLKPENLMQFLKPIAEATPKTKPLLLKLSPDMSDAELFSALDVSLQIGFSGWILTNTTLQRKDDMKFPSEGGVSGRPLAQLSKAILKKALLHLGDRRANKLIISVGGVMSADDVIERLELGADLVQVYSALIFEGPLFFQKVAKKMQRVDKNG